MRRHRGGAGAGAAGQGDADAALPHPHAQMRRGPAPGRIRHWCVLGNSGWVSIRGPELRPPAPSPHRRTNSTQWGLPIETALRRKRRAADVQREIGWCRRPRASGISSQSSRGAPMSTVTRPLPASLQISRPPSVSSLTRGQAASRPSAGARRSAWRCRRLSTSPPSALKNAHDGVGAARARRRSRSPCRSRCRNAGRPARAACAASSAMAAVARVEHDEIVAQAVHFQERGHGGLIGGRCGLCHCQWRSRKSPCLPLPIAGASHARGGAFHALFARLRSLPHSASRRRREPRGRRSLCLAGRCAWRKSRSPGWRSRTKSRWAC